MSDALDSLLAWGRALRPARVLDVTAGDGQTALAFAAIARSLVTCDVMSPPASARTLAAGHGASNVRYAAGDVAALPFADGAFDLVTCRLAAHRFLEPAAAMREVRRVLRPAGTLLLQDVLGHDDAEANAFIRALERRRDPTHVRAYRTAEWKAFLRAAGLTVMEQTTVPTIRVWRDWTDGTKPETTADMERLVHETPARIRGAFDFRLDATGIAGFTDRMLLVRAERD